MREVVHCCSEMKRRIDHPNVGVRFFEKVREYGVSLLGSSGTVRIDFCPWCGLRLPTSLRDRRYEELLAMGIDDPLTQPVPPEFETSEWYIRRHIP